MLSLWIILSRVCECVKSVHIHIHTVNHKRVLSCMCVHVCERGNEKKVVFA